ncbi:MAG TPA: trehalase family glycosidase [Candidatus Methylacidiphilales bacterium]
MFPPLVAFAQWFRKHRTWPDGTYYSSGWGCGMDNQPRVAEGYDERFDHGHMSWVDTTLQQILADRLLVKMGEVLGRTGEVSDLSDEAERLTHLVNQQLWNETEAFYFDRYRDGSLSSVKTIGAFWALLAEVVPPERLDRFISHLQNPREFNRPHRIPSLSADHPDYDNATGDYWLGGVWSPTNYMVLRGLNLVNEDSLAHEIAVNHLQNVVEAFKKTGTVWENYAPESSDQGKPAKPHFVGWTGLSPIAILLEDVLGLRADASHQELLWDVRLLETHGVSAYPFGRDTVIRLRCEARRSVHEEPIIEADANRRVTLIVRWASGEKTIDLGPE